MKKCSRLVVHLISLIFLYDNLLKTSNAAEVISRTQGNILRNLTRSHSYRNNIVTSMLDTSPPILWFYRGFREFYSRIISDTGKRSGSGKLQKPISNNVAFPCDVSNFRSRQVPTSVHQLRPGDIDIVAALGDSLTSATAANAQGLWEVLVENRGLSWCIGGQETWRTHLTLPNILKVFNPNLFGYSLSDSYSVHRSSQFNVGENIATTSDMPYNAKLMVQRISNDNRVNFKKHWKLLTFMIGGNDFCSDICYQTNATNWINESQEKNLIKTLVYLRDNMPRTLVNLVPTPLINLLFSMDDINTPLSCQLSRPIECSCLFGPVYSNKRDLYRKLERNFVKIMERVSHRPELHTDEFTVVYQPFFKDASVKLNKNNNKDYDLSIMSIDCVHLSQKGHAVSANSLWNNMLEPVGRKTLGLTPMFQQFKCPTETQPYIFTNYNSA